MRIKVKMISALVLPGLLLAGRLTADDFASLWPEEIERVWVGPEYWSNSLEDWRVAGGRLECINSGGDRNVYLLTRELRPETGGLEMEVTLGGLDSVIPDPRRGWAGFKVGARGEFNDYRDSAIRGRGLAAGLTMGGRLFIGSVEQPGQPIAGPFWQVRLSLAAQPEQGNYRLTLRADDKEGRELARLEVRDVHPDWLEGSLALVCSSSGPEPREANKPRPAIVSDPNDSPAGQERGGSVRFWFKDWKISGSKVAAHEDHLFGPVLFAQHTLSRQVLKLTAQMPPVGNGCRVVGLQIVPSGEQEWKTIAEAVIDPLACTASFRVSRWDDTRDTPYRLVYPLLSAEGKTVEHYFTGTVKKDPRDKTEITVVAFTGNNDFGFPHADVVGHVRFHRPDLLAFTGDQIYERTGDYGDIKTRDVKMAALDYLRKWYLFGWEYRDLLRDTPNVCLPDDHDVYQGNVWGDGGHAADLSQSYAAGTDGGGYCMPPLWVDMIQRTQTSHMADPYDPTPVEQGISVYYGPMLYGGVSFAIIEDRKWKSSPTMKLPEAKIINGWAQNPDFDSAKEGDVPGAELLGPRQEKFLERWAADWSGGAWMKVVVSQTLFANVATLPPPANSDEVTPRLKVMKQGEYSEGEHPVQDHDSNGWPQSGRNRALDYMRRAFAFHISGDQHLGSTVQYGIEDWHDAGFALCVPSVANVWPRRWFPSEPGKNRAPGAPRYTGDFKDGFGNRISVYAVSNPYADGIEPAWINHRAPGYGIVKFNRETRKISVANWPRWVDPSTPGARPYPGWPVTFDQTDNYGRKASAWLPELTVSGLDDPVVQVIDEAGGEIVYTLRIRGGTFRPKVFKEGFYRLKVGEPGTEKMKVLTHLQALPEGAAKKIELQF